MDVLGSHALRSADGVRGEGWQEERMLGGLVGFVMHSATCWADLIRVPH